MFALLKRYFLQIIFAVCVVIGLQLPHFLQQYELRLQGHFSEAKQQLLDYQLVAEKYYSGDLHALIRQHQQSDIAAFKDQADIIERSAFRVQYLQQKITQTAAPIWIRLSLLIKEIGRPIFNETWRHYQANIVLNQTSLLVGLVVAVVIMLGIECLLYLCFKICHVCFLRIRKRH